MSVYEIKLPVVKPLAPYAFLYHISLILYTCTINCHAVFLPILHPLFLSNLSFDILCISLTLLMNDMVLIFMFIICISLENCLAWNFLSHSRTIVVIHIQCANVELLLPSEENSLQNSSAHEFALEIYTKYSCSEIYWNPLRFLVTAYTMSRMDPPLRPPLPPPPDGASPPPHAYFVVRVKSCGARNRINHHGVVMPFHSHRTEYY